MRNIQILKQFDDELIRKIGPSIWDTFIRGCISDNKTSLFKILFNNQNDVLVAMNSDSYICI